MSSVEEENTAKSKTGGNAMSKADVIEVEGTVLEKLPNAMFKVELENFEYNHYGTPNKKLAEILPAKYTKDPALFPPSDVLDNCEIFRSLDRGTQDYYSKLWKEIKLD